MYASTRAMVLLYIFLIGCAITGIVALGVIFALAAAGYGELPQDAEIPPAETSPSAEADEPIAAAIPIEHPD